MPSIISAEDLWFTLKQMLELQYSKAYLTLEQQLVLTRARVQVEDWADQHKYPLTWRNRAPEAKTFQQGKQLEQLEFNWGVEEQTKLLPNPDEYYAEFHASSSPS